MHGIDELLEADAPVVVLVEDVKDALHEERLQDNERVVKLMMTTLPRFPLLTQHCQQMTALICSVGKQAASKLFVRTAEKRS